MTLPAFLVIGAPRSGTTTLANQLRAHPSICIPDEKELFFFNRHWTKGPDWYARQFDCGDRSIAGEATPLYLADPDVPARMAELVPSARLVAILREPVSRAWSHYWHRRAWGHEKRSFEQAISDELERHDQPLEARYIEVGRYHEQITRLLEHFPQESLEVVLLDDLRADPTQLLERICAHIGADPAALPEMTDQPHNASYALRSYRMHLFLWRTRLYPRMPRRLAYLIHGWNERPIPTMDAGLRRALTDELAPSTRKLLDWLGRPDAW